MTQELEGGCRVHALREGEPFTHAGVRAWSVVGRHSGARHVSLRTLEFGPGPPAVLSSDCDDVWYVVSGRARLEIDGREHAVEPATGIYLAPGTVARVLDTTSEPLLVASVRCPEPRGMGLLAEDGDRRAAAEISRSPASTPRPPIARLADRAKETTGDRWYQVLVDRSLGSEQVSQFVGCIPPGRAPDHYHNYEEVIVILEGRGRMWAGNTSAPVGVGSVIYLPIRQVHCLENTGDGPLLLLGAFYPAGSPAVRYDAES